MDFLRWQTANVNSNDGSSEGPPPSEFVEAVKDALDHVYDFTRLNNHHLGQLLLPNKLPRGVSHAQALRQRLIDAIERVNPGSRLTDSTRQKRAYHLLELRYVEALSFRDVMRTLALSQAQYHREQRHAVEMVAVYLWDTMPEPTGISGQPRSEADTVSPGRLPSKVAASTTELTVHPGGDDLPLGTFLAEIVELVESVAVRQNVRLQLQAPIDGAITVDRTTLRSALISALGYILGFAQDGVVTLSIEHLTEGVRLDLCYAGPSPAGLDNSSEVEQIQLSRELIQAIGGSLHLTHNQTSIVVSLGLPSDRSVLLVVDDNPDLVQLIARYLTDQNYLVLSAGSVDEGIEVAHQANPDVILLDVMMPHHDGWDALQLLRHHPATAETPVVVCSVLSEAKLAEALGARAFIRKPLTRPALLHVLAQCRSDRSPAAVGDREENGSPAGSER